MDSAAHSTRAADAVNAADADSASRKTPARGPLVRRVLLSATRRWMFAFAGVAALLVAGAVLMPEGEVVRVISLDGAKRQHETDLWIVSLDGFDYLRAGSPDAAWLARIRAHPDITLVRGERESGVRAVVLDRPEIRERVNRAMAEKYGFADRLWARIGDHDRAVPMRLVPRERLQSRVHAGPSPRAHP